MSKIYDLEDRTLKFSKEIVNFCRLFQDNKINSRLADQLLRSGTSMGANYREANETETRKDFLYRLRICRKEGKETMYWLNLVLEVSPDNKIKIEHLLDETEQLIKIFCFNY